MNDMNTNHDKHDDHETHARDRRRHCRELDLNDPDLTEPDLVMHLARRLRRGAAVETAPWGLSPHQARALQAIAWRESGHRRGRGHGRGKREEGTDAPKGQRISELADRLRIAARSATEVADGLQEAGLVQRTPDPKDRRAVLLTLTERGTEVSREIRAARRQATADAAGSMSEQDRAELRRLLIKLLESLEAEPQG